MILSKGTDFNMETLMGVDFAIKYQAIQRTQGRPP
jgi:hypothetical protein